MGKNIETRQDGKLVYLLGVSRSGKTYWLKQQLKKVKRVLVWDSKGEYAMMRGYQEIKNLSELHKAMTGTGIIADKKLAYTGELKTFEPFCRYAFQWLIAKRGVLVVEELADVTSPGKAVPGWGDICRKALAYAPVIFAVTQRPQEADRTVFGNATLIHCHMLTHENDRLTVARGMGIAPEKIPTEKYSFIEKEAGSPVINKVYRHKTG